MIRMSVITRPGSSSTRFVTGSEFNVIFQMALEGKAEGKLVYVVSEMLKFLGFCEPTQFPISIPNSVRSVVAMNMGSGCE